MKIVFISNSSWYLYNFRLNLMKNLRDNGHTIIIYSPFDSYSYLLTIEGFSVTNFNLNPSSMNPFTVLYNFLNFNNLFKNKNISLIISFTPKINIYSAFVSILYNIKFLPGISGLGRVFIKKSIGTLITILLYKLSFWKASKVFFENNDDKNLFKSLKLIKCKQSVVLPGAGIDSNHFSENLFPPVFIKPNSFTFLLIARLLWDKGVGEYVESAKIIKLKYPFVNFRL